MQQYRVTIRSSITLDESFESRDEEPIERATIYLMINRVRQYRNNNDIDSFISLFKIKEVSVEKAS
jgi:hypothetical protein